MPGGDGHALRQETSTPQSGPRPDGEVVGAGRKVDHRRVDGGGKKAPASDIGLVGRRGKDHPADHGAEFGQPSSGLVGGLLGHHLFDRLEGRPNGLPENEAA